MNKTKRFLCLLAALATLTPTALGLTGCGLSGFRNDSDYEDDQDDNGDKNTINGIFDGGKVEISNGVVVSKVETIDGELIITYTDGTRVNLGAFGGGVQEAQGLVYYPLSDGSYGVKMGSSLYMDAITIPDTYNGAPVTQILPDGFAGAYNLRSIDIPNSVQVIGENAFSGCHNLSSITMPSNLTRIESYAFYDCGSLYDVYVSNVEGWLNTWIEDEWASPSANTGATVHLMNSYGEEIVDLQIPSTLSTVSPYALAGCRNLTFVSIPDSVSYIADGAFMNCSNLSSIQLPAKLMEIGARAFAGCSCLMEMTLPDSLENVGFGIFSGCTALESLSLPFLGNYRNGTDNSYLGYTFGAPDCYDNESFVPSSLRNVSITNCTEIGYKAFEDCYNLTSITISHNVSFIADEAFRGCSGLSSITIPSGVTTIGQYAFADCSGLTEVTVPDNVEFLGCGVFSSCYNLHTITLPFVGDSRDGYNYTNFGYIFGTTSSYDNGSYIPSSLQTVVLTNQSFVPDEAFRGCSYLQTVTLPDFVTSIGSRAFLECGNLSAMTIPDGVESIGSATFQNCQALQYVTVPTSVISIDEYAFAYCYGLSDIYYAGSEYDWENNIYKGTDWNWDTSGYSISYNYVP